MAHFAKLRNDLISTASEEDGQTVHTVKDPITGNFFRLRDPEFWLINRLNGERSPDEVAAQFVEKFELNITGEQVMQFVNHLESLYFLEGTRSEQEISRAVRKSFQHKSLLGKILFYKIKAYKPGRSLEFLHKIYRPFHNWFTFVTATIFTLFGLSLVLSNSDQFFGAASVSFFSLESLPVIVVSLFLIIIIHEYAHAVTCRYYGGEVREVGFLLMYLQPCFYCDVSDAWLFEKKSQRLAVSLAGPLVQLLMTAMAAVVWRVVVPGTFISDVARVTITVSLVTYLFNFNPLIKLDGYYILSDWLEIPNLRSKSFSYFGNIAKRKLLGWPIDQVKPPQRQQRALITYALLALTYTSILIGFILFLLGRWLIGSFGAFGLLLLLVLVGAIIKPKLKSSATGIVTHFKYMKKLLKQPLRLAIHISIVVVVIASTMLVQVPNRVSGEVIVRPVAEFQISMNEFGLIESNFRQGGIKPDDKISIMQMNSSEMGTLDFVPLVRDGETVKKNDTLAILVSNQITQAISSAGAELKRLRGKLTLLGTPPKIEEIREAQARAEAASVAYNQKLNDYERAEGLAAKELISKREIDDARSALNLAQADWTSEKSRVELLKAPPRPEEEAVIEQEIEKQQARLEFLRSQGDAQIIASPFDGIVSRHKSDRTILSVIDHATIELLIPVSDFDISKVKIGQDVTVKVRSYPDKMFTGKVIRIPEAANETNGQYYFEVSALFENNDALLHDGMSGYAKIETGESSVLGLLYDRTLSRVRVEFWSLW